jgi:hypothetical protein
VGVGLHAFVLVMPTRDEARFSVDLAKNRSSFPCLAFPENAMSPEQLRATLSEIGMSQAALARYVHADPATVNRWARGGCRIPYLLVLVLENLRQQQHGADGEERRGHSGSFTHA